MTLCDVPGCREPALEGDDWAESLCVRHSDAYEQALREGRTHWDAQTSTALEHEEWYSRWLETQAK